jgi:hypothetical protein
MSPRSTEARLLAQLHAALDSIFATEDLIESIKSSSGLPPVAVVRAGEHLERARELLRWLLVHSTRAGETTSSPR